MTTKERILVKSSLRNSPKYSETFAYDQGGSIVKVKSRLEIEQYSTSMKLRKFTISQAVAGIHLLKYRPKILESIVSFVRGHQS